MGSSPQTVRGPVLPINYIPVVGGSSYLLCGGPPVDASWLVVNTHYLINRPRSSGEGLPLPSQFISKKVGAESGDRLGGQEWG